MRNHHPNYFGLPSIFLDPFQPFFADFGGRRKICEKKEKKRKKRHKNAEKREREEKRGKTNHIGGVGRGRGGPQIFLRTTWLSFSLGDLCVSSPLLGDNSGGFLQGGMRKEKKRKK